MLSKNVSRFIILIPIAIFYYFICQNSLNLPFQDDFDGIYGALHNILSANGFLEKLKIFFQPDDEHRVFFDRLITFLLYKTTGEVNLRHHLFIGNLLILGIFGLIVLSYQKARLPHWGLVPVAFFLFQIQYNEGIFWGMIPCQNFAVVFFAFLTLYLLSQNTRTTFYWAILVAFITVFSNSNGMFTLVPSVAILIYQRRWKLLIVWLLWMSLLVGGYFYGLVIPSFRPKPLNNLRNYPSTIIADFFAFVGQYVDLGSTLSLNTRGFLSIGLGVVLVVWILFLVVQKILNFLKNLHIASDKVPVFWVAGLILIAVTAAIFGVGRASDGFAAVFMSRYKLSTTLAVTLSYCTLLAWVSVGRQRLVIVLGIMMSVFFNFYSYFQGFETVRTFRKTQLTDSFSYRYGKNVPSSPIYFAIKDDFDAIYQNALKDGSFKHPQTVFSAIESQLLNDTLSSINTPRIPLEISEDKDNIRFVNQDFVIGNQQDDGVYILLKNEKEAHLFRTKQKRRSLKGFLTTQQYYANGFESASVLKKALSKGTYRVACVILDGSQKRVFYTGQSIEIAESFKN
jgi:hypothetical protein